MDGFGGLNPTHAVAGFGGGLAYLPFMSPSGKLAVLLAVVAGVVTASFATPITVEALDRFLQWKVSARAEMGLAFLLGLTAMTLIPIVLGIVGWIRDNIARLAAKIFGVPPAPPSEKKEEDKTP